MEPKLAFFDVDGTLSAPCYEHAPGKNLIGVSDEDWLAFLEREGEDAYKDCAPLPCVRDYAKYLKGKGLRLFVLSSSASETESAAKIKFLRAHYDGLFEDFFFTAHDSEKLDVIRREAEKAAVLPAQCVFVEDTYRTLLAAATEGIICIHVANIIAGNCTENGVTKEVSDIHALAL